jgi:hypothetical protein
VKSKDLIRALRENGGFVENVRCVPLRVQWCAESAVPGEEFDDEA